MLLPMLKAVRDMIYIPISPEIPRPVVDAKIECARVILSEIISTLEENPKQVEKTEQHLATRPVLEPKPILEDRPTVEAKDDEEWMITLDDGGGLKIVDFPLDRQVEIDGKKMAYELARGQKFKKARIL